MTVKERLHQAVESMSDKDAVALLHTLRQDFAQYLEGLPLDDEGESEEERLALLNARAEVAAGHVVAWKDVRRSY